MVHNPEKLDKAQDFRKRGFTYDEIAKMVDVSKGTISNWFSNKAFSKKVRKDNETRARRDNVKRIALLNKARAREREKRYSEATKSAATEFKHYKHNQSFIVGVMLYASVGDVSLSEPIRISHTNTSLHRIFVKFAIEFLGIERSSIHCWLAVPPDSGATGELKIWSKELRIPLPQFYKSQKLQLASSTRLRKTVGNTIIGNAYSKRKLLRWIELASKELSK